MSYNVATDLVPRIRKLYNDEDKENYAVSSRRMTEFVENEYQTWFAPRINESTVRTSAAITLVPNTFSYAFKPSGGHQSIVELILDSINMPIQRIPPNELDNMRVGTTPAKSNYPQFCSLEENSDGSNSASITVRFFPTPSAADTVSTVTSPIPLSVGSGVNGLQVTFPMLLGLAKRIAGVCIMSLDADELARKKVGPNLGQLFLNDAEMMLTNESARIRGFKQSGRVLEVMG